MSTMIATTWARGVNAWGLCMRSGQREKLNELISDGYNPGILVRTRDYDPPHPQERLQKLVDAQALRRPSPDVDRANQINSAWFFGVSLACQVGLIAAEGETLVTPLDVPVSMQVEFGLAQLHVFEPGMEVIGGLA